MNFIKLITHGIRMLMPFMDKIATRAIVAFALSFAVGTLLIAGTIASYVYNSTPVSSVVVFGIVTTALIGTVSLGQLLILFATFSQSQAISMGRIEDAQSHFHSDTDFITTDTNEFLEPINTGLAVVGTHLVPQHQERFSDGLRRE